jgi:hypothetical protein
VAKPKKLSIEHVLPQTWEHTWPLDDPTPAAAEARASVTEISAELAELTPDELTIVLSGSFELMRQLMADLAARPGKRRRFVEVEDSLGWSRGRLASVLGGFANFSKAMSEASARTESHRTRTASTGCGWMTNEQARSGRAFKVGTDQLARSRRHRRRCEA